MLPLPSITYDRRRAVEYAHRWAYFRNPQFYDFSELGGDCTNFASQCLLAGSGVMNFTPTYGWYYRTVDDRTASWTGVEYFYNFLVKNKGVGPFAVEAPIEEMRPGDFIQFMADQGRFQHTPVVTEIRGITPTPTTIYVAAHSGDCDCRPLNSYSYQKIRFLHIEGVRYRPPGFLWAQYSDEADEPDLSS
ncbi:MAG: amidase domain-containing protein [Oscillospiraceae bacterium]